MGEKLNTPGGGGWGTAKKIAIYGGLGVLALAFLPEAIHWGAEQLGEAGAEIALHIHEAVSGVVGPDIIHPAVYS